MYQWTKAVLIKPAILAVGEACKTALANSFGHLPAISVAEN